MTITQTSLPSSREVGADRAGETGPLPGLDSEEWRDVPGWEGLYQVSSEGRVKSFMGPRGIPWPEPKILRPSISTGYAVVNLRGKMLRVNRLVALAFHGEPPEGKPFCRHIDGNPMNNHPSNLVWGSPKENSDDMLRHGTRQFGEAHPNTYLSAEQVREIYSLRGSGISSNVLGPRYGAAGKTIRNIWRGLTWRTVTGA